MYLGPGGGTLPALSSSIMSSMSFGKRSSWKQEESRINEKKAKKKVLGHSCYAETFPSP